MKTEKKKPLSTTEKFSFPILTLFFCIHFLRLVPLRAYFRTLWQWNCGREGFAPHIKSTRTQSHNKTTQFNVIIMIIDVEWRRRRRRKYEWGSRTSHAYGPRHAEREKLMRPKAAIDYLICTACVHVSIWDRLPDETICVNLKFKTETCTQCVRTAFHCTALISHIGALLLLFNFRI